MGLDGLVGSETGFVSLASDPEAKHKWYGSGFLKQERSATTEDDDLRSSKLAKTNNDDKAMQQFQLQQQNKNSSSSSLRSNATLFSDGHHQQHMLSFSSPKLETYSLDKNNPNATLSYSYHPLSSYSRNTGTHHEKLAFFEVMCEGVCLIQFLIVLWDMEYLVSICKREIKNGLLRSDSTVLVEGLFMEIFEWCLF